MDSQDIQRVDLEPQLEEDATEKDLTVGSDVGIEENNDVNVGIDKNDDNNMKGMVFDNPDESYEFYNSYAFLHGFGIRKHTTYKNKTTSEPYRKKYVCNKEGFKDLKSKSSSGDAKKCRRDLRNRCEAFILISKGKDGTWIVDLLNDVHNHELIINPTKVIKYRSHGKFHRSMACKSLMSELSQNGLKPCQIKKVINTVKSPIENDVTSKQCADILAEERKQYRGLQEIFFWADGRSRDSYVKFGDVLVFDVAYMTNKFKMSFASFVGVNHH
ncbi:protein FAR1-RELATED SEQUENCE 5-like [Bidens hawaiensis]|uniref:protein FAR1-RELATED SEQUENCE 5-like n=1 Tax=Bidens hawaiensis TaxID=980011 RepID=UPI00404A04F2